MWLVDKVLASVDEDENYDGWFPYFYYDASARNLFRSIVVRLKRAGTHETVDIKVSSHNWGSLNESLDKYKPYGCISVNNRVARTHSDYHLIAINDICYDFLDLVDSIEEVGFDYPVVKKAGKSFIDRNRVVPLDDDMTLFSLQPHRVVVRGGFPLLYIILHHPENWLRDGNFYLRRGFGHNSAYRVNFTDMQRAKTYLAKAAVAFGTDPIEAIKSLLQVRGTW